MKTWKNALEYKYDNQISNAQTAFIELLDEPVVNCDNNMII
jgi:hypothetical protein